IRRYPGWKCTRRNLASLCLGPSRISECDLGTIISCSEWLTLPPERHASIPSPPSLRYASIPSAPPLRYASIPSPPLLSPRIPARPLSAPPPAYPQGARPRPRPSGPPDPWSLYPSPEALLQRLQACRKDF